MNTKSTTEDQKHAVGVPRLASLIDTLETVERAMDNFGSLITNRQLPKRNLERPIRMGLVISIGMVYPCDDDGMFQEHRAMREGYILTEEGFDFLMANSQDQARKAPH